MKRLLCILALITASLGCGKKVTVHPGAISNLDSYAYDVLLVEQDVLNQAKADYQSGALGDAAKAPLNGAIKQYNITQDLWQSYHAGGNNADVLSKSLSALVTLVGDIQKLRGKSATPVPTSGLTWPNRLQPVYGGAL